MLINKISLEVVAGMIPKSVRSQLIKYKNYGKVTGATSTCHFCHPTDNDKSHFRIMFI